MATTGTPVDEVGLRVLLGRVHHEVATPLLTATGFARIARDLVAARPADDAADDELAATLARVVDGLERARATLAAARALGEDPGLARTDLVDLLRSAADHLADRGTPVVLAALPSTIVCHGVPATLHELLVGLLELFVHDRGPAGDPTLVEVSASGALHVSSVVVTLSARADPWPPDVLAPAGPMSPGPASLASRLAAIAAGQLGRLWLDPDPDPEPGHGPASGGGRRVATLRLLAGDRPAPHDEDVQ